MSQTQILLVEDNPGDVRLTREAFRDRHWVNRLNVVEDGVAALAYLRRESGYEQSPRPDLILLDLNLPRMDGREVLRFIKNDPSLRLIPVVVLTTSNAPEDVASAYGHHANGYVQKPMRLEEFGEAVRAIEKFWLSTALLPGREMS